MSLERGARLGPYEVVELLGAGGMGEVYRARDTVLGRDVALKVLPASLASNPDRLARLRREAQVLAALNHPNVAQIYGFESRSPRSGNQDTSSHALVLELVEGPTLADRLTAGPLDMADLLAIARQIAMALGAAHDAGIVHRDLKPANIKVRGDGTVKVLDFGIAKAMEPDAALAGVEDPPGAAMTVATGEAPQTREGLILGTLSYMSPEQARGRSVDMRADIWAFGVVLAEMATGRRLFDGATTSDTIAAVLTQEPDFKLVPPSLRRLIRQCLAKDPRERLRHIGDAMALVDESPPTATPSRTRGTPSWVAVTALVALLLSAVAVSWIALRPRAVADAIARFTIDAPPGTAFNYTYTATAIAPDGRQLVFRVATATEAPALWLRPLETLVGRRIAGTDGADFPFWSPDGRSIGFFSGGKLKRADVGGGDPIALCEASDADTLTAGGSWSADGVIIFGTPQGVYRVSASGGAPTLVAPVDSSAGETGYGAPQFLPDGDRFLMFVRSESKARTGLYGSSLSRPDRKTMVLPTRSKALFVANEGGDSSYLLYLQDRTLLARRMDRRTLALIGDPAPIASNVALFPPGFHASFWSSSSGNLLAYRTEATDKPRLTWIYPDGKRKSETGTEEFYTHVRVSRDGSRAAMELADGTGNMDIWTMDFARHLKTRVTFDAKPDRFPTWSPDGSELAFSSLRSGVWQIFRKDADSGQPEQQLTMDTGDKIAPDWSHDGRYLLFIRIGSSTSEDIGALPLEGNNEPFPVLQTPAIETHPALSPDGEWLAFESSEFGRPEVFVIRFPRSRPPATAPPARWQISTQGGSRPRWSADGRALFYVSLDELRIMRARVRRADPGFRSELPEVYAEIPVMSGLRSPFDVCADGRLLVLERTISQSAPLVVNMNWSSELARR